ncbi:hypothetical protein [Mycoplasmopsis agassizii]|uniref:Lipoprotein n=1 Tax=Mycoplasmopsis agassizii TaxID=33922 RepID=A0ABX4H6F1_9BACT|nr:hypothetical protein [Mycoplasmopsis agassizii]PAF55477.1 hypothetical protein CJF60_02215 [Mycoplasmopsis agassizii]SMC18940.1 hypothetical protein SAMN02745179_00810 [Mycoplasmopsis agassizii]
MLHLHIQKFRKKFTLKKVLLFSGLLAIPAFTSLAIACASYGETLTDEDKRFAETGKGTDISLKTLGNKKVAVQLKHVGYEYFTFSDYWWSEYTSRDIRYVSHMGSYGIDAEKSISDADRKSFWEKDKTNPNLENSEVFFKLDSIDNLKKEISKNTVLENSIKQENQNTSDKQFKSVSLITDEASLKTQLRLTDEEKQKFSKFIKEKVDSKLKDEEIEKLKPWNSHFNYNLINQKLDLENNNYLFVKDLTKMIKLEGASTESELTYHKVNKGIQIDDYQIDKENKIITLKFSYKYIPTIEGLIKDDKERPNRFVNPETITSFLLPVSKSELSDFDMSEWKIVTDKTDSISKNDFSKYPN